MPLSLARSRVVTISKNRAMTNCGAREASPFSKIPGDFSICIYCASSPRGQSRFRLNAFILYTQGHIFAFYMYLYIYTLSIRARSQPHPYAPVKLTYRSTSHRWSVDTARTNDNYRHLYVFFYLAFARGKTFPLRIYKHNFAAEYARSLYIYNSRRCS